MNGPTRRSIMAGIGGVPFAAHAATLLPASSPCRFVDPFIGTDGSGHCFPGPSMPFGMVQPSPDNADKGWDYTSGYQYRAPTIMGFSQTHASGTGIPELGDLLLQPVAALRDGDLASRYDKASEVARPGYYAVRLTDNQVSVELTAGKRVALHRYRFGRGGRVHVLVDTQHRLRFIDGERVVSATVTPTVDGVEGSVDSVNWASRTAAFALKFDRPVVSVRELPRQGTERAPRYLFGFDLGDDGVLHAKAAVSTVDPAGARRNLEEVSGWDFDAVARTCDAAWAALLGRVDVDADMATKRSFYTGLYHLMLQPTVISDSDGRYRGADGMVAKARGRDYYSTLSLWDTFRAAHPLYTLLVPERVDDFILTMLDHARVQGYLPMWAMWGRETFCMIGNPALPVIADAWAKGFRGFDGREALAAMVASSTVDHPMSQWAVYDHYGYYPFDKTEGSESVSKTLEAGIGDAATARMAVMLGDSATATRFGKRAGSYKALIDPETRLARARDGKGAWRTPFDPRNVTATYDNPGDYTEANAWQYSWTPALHDVDGLVAAMGGRASFTAMLDRFFATAPISTSRTLGQEALIGQYAHANEPSHHIAWLYAWSDKPARGRDLVKQIATRFYRDTPDGIIGNDDCGQSSAWYVFAAMGFYPVDPASGRFVIGEPLVDRVALKVPGRRPLVIRRDRRAGVRLNGRSLGREVAYRDLVGGGELAFGGQRG